MKGCKAFVRILFAFEILAWVFLAQQVAGQCSGMLKPCRCDLNEKDVVAVNCTNTEIVGNKLELEIEYSVINFTFSGNFVEKLSADFIKQCKDGRAALPNLKMLDVSRNNITAIDPALFTCLPNLETLVLRKNNLFFNATTSPMLENLSNLKELNLEEAFLTKTNESFYDKNKGRNMSIQHSTEIQWVFSKVSLPNLETLHLEHNSFWYINSTALCQPLPKLEKLYLSHNHIRPSNMNMTCLSHLKVLYLDNNAVTFLPETFIDQLNKSHLLQGQLNLTENPWQCDCNFHHTLQWLKSDASHFVINKSSLWCYVERKRKYIVNLEESDLTCEYAVPLDKRLKNSYIVLACVFAAIGIMFLFVLYLNRDKIFRVGKRCVDPFLNYNPNAPRGTYSSVAV